MLAVPTVLAGWGSFLADVGQFSFGLVTVGLTIYAAVFRRNEIFRTSLQKSQFDEVSALRMKLHEIFFDLYYLPHILGMMKTMGWNVD